MNIIHARIIRSAILPGLLCLSFAFAIRAKAQDAPPKFDQFDKAMEVLADSVARYVVRQPDARESIIIGPFTGPAGSTGGSRIVESLRSHLAKDKRLKIIEGRGYKLTGRYECDLANRTEPFEVVVVATIQELGGRELHDFRERVTLTNAADVISLLGLNVATSEPGAQPKDIATAKPGRENKDAPKTPGEVASTDQKLISKSLANSLKNPNVYIEEDRIARASSSSPYGIEVVLKTPKGYETCTIDPSHAVTGTAQVDIDMKQVFAIRIYNATQHNVGCALTIDGINVFAFSQNRDWKGLGKMVICPGKSLIKGWHHDGDVSHEFMVTKYGDSAAARLGAIDRLGTITATFFEIGKDGLRSDGAAGFGEQVVQPYSSMPATFGNVVSAVSVQYLRPPQDLPMK